MNFIPDSIREEYKTLKILRRMAESETNSIPVETIQEQSNALDHLMRATEEDSEQQIQQARAHFIRAGRDLYFTLLTPKLDRLQALSAFLPSAELERFRKEYEKIMNSVQASRAEPMRIPNLTEYVRSLEEIDTFLSSLTKLEIEVATTRKLRKKSYKHVLIAILFTLLGAAASLLFGILMK